jgi:CHASE2 domain-containing sensor protein
MPIYQQPNLTGGIDDAIVDTVSAVPIFTPMFLLFVFLVILLGGSINQKRRTGSADLPMWSVIASISTLVVSLIMSMQEGLIQLEIVTIMIAITFASGVWLYLDKNRNEV